MRKRYSSNIVVYDIPGDLYPARFLDKQLKRCGINFSKFFHQAVIVSAQELLYTKYSKEFKRDKAQYAKFYKAMLNSDVIQEDGRVSNAVRGEVKTWSRCVADNVPRVNFLDIATPAASSSTRRDGGAVENMVRVQLDVRDKLDLRVVAASFDIPLWQYIGEAITEGMLKLHIRYSTTPEEKALLVKNVDENVNEILQHDTMLAIFDRVVCEYYTNMTDCYHGAPPVLRAGLDEYAAKRLRESIFDRGDLWH